MSYLLAVWTIGTHAPTKQIPQYDVYGSPKRHTISTLDILQIMRVVSHIPASRPVLHRWAGTEMILHSQPTGDRML